MAHEPVTAPERTDAPHQPVSTMWQRSVATTRPSSARATRAGGGSSAAMVTECAQLRIRVVALENLVIALLAQAPERQLMLARDMARHISPRAGFTPHRLTLHAADEMRSLVDRSARFRSAQVPP